MINSHKELVKEVLNWADKFEFVKQGQYVTDIGNLDANINNMEHRGFLFSPIDFAHDYEYNSSVTYGFSFIDKTTDNLEAILTSEDENLFCVSALSDFINRIADGDIDFDAMSMNNQNTESGVITSVSGQFTFNIKRTASYWKIMEQYDAD